MGPAIPSFPLLIRDNTLVDLTLVFIYFWGRPFLRGDGLSGDL